MIKNQSGKIFRGSVVLTSITGSKLQEKFMTINGKVTLDASKYADQVIIVTLKTGNKVKNYKLLN